MASYQVPAILSYPSLENGDINLASDNIYTRCDVIDFQLVSFQAWLLPSMCVYVSVLWKEYSVQGRSKTLQGVFVVLGPGWNAVMSGRIWQCDIWFGCLLVYVKH